MRKGYASWILAALLVANVAAAQTKTLAETLTGPAKSDYETARLLFTDGDFVGAEIKFKSAYETSHDARLLWNMAACEKSQRHYARAVDLVHKYLDAGQSM